MDGPLAGGATSIGERSVTGRRRRHQLEPGAACRRHGVTLALLSRGVRRAAGGGRRRRSRSHALTEA